MVCPKGAAPCRIQSILDRRQTPKQNLPRAPSDGAPPRGQCRAASKWVAVRTHKNPPVAAPSQSECYEDLLHRQLQYRTFFELNCKAGGALVKGGLTPETYFAEFGWISEQAPWGTAVLSALLARFQAGRYLKDYQLSNADAFGVGYFLAPGKFSALNSLTPPV